ncbi:nitrate- and nitrite sensing domain-containing protein [Streptomyces sp. NPDC093252]|uniref:nitrate- and nitrite sensing domain-containing protein n=1 Tax=Streptomyces sp. NPDC093252 TaxID=3154980 RepID=UPI00342FA7BE
MRFRGKSIRRKIVALLLVPLVSMSALWAFGMVLTGQEASGLFTASSVVEDVGYPTEDTVRVLQQERRQTLVHLADPRDSDGLAALRRTRAATDEAVAELRKNAGDPGIRDAMGGATGERLTAVLEAFDGIWTLRRSVEDGTVNRSQALDLYNRLIDPCYTLLTNLHAVEDVELDKQYRALVGLSRARELLAREDALLGSALVVGSLSAAEVRDITDLVAQRSLTYDVNLPLLPTAERNRYERFWKNADSAPLRVAEESALASGSGTPRHVDAGDWDEAAGKVLDQLGTLNDEASDRYQDRVRPIATGVIVRVAFAAALGLAALLLSLLVSVRIGRGLIRDLRQLRLDAHEASGVRLPSVMRRLSAGEQVDVETEVPRLEYDRNEIGEVGQALNTLQRAAVEAAVKQAELRSGVSEVFVNLARRSQVLLHKQLTLLDTMERRTEDTEELADLFRLDHLTTRMRRHAEGLVILSGAAPSRQWRKPIQLMDVVRAAVAEVEDYERIEVRRLPRTAITGPAVADLTHLVAELLENATVFSPPHTAVQVIGERVANGFTLEIHDRGLGMAAEALLDANLRLAETPEFELSDTDRLGLFVVSRLAQRQNVRVSLQPSPYGGTTAVVFIPDSLLTDAVPDTNGTGFRLDRPRAAGEGPHPDLAQRPVQLPGLPASLLDGPVELEAPVDLDAIRDFSGVLGDEDSERGGIFRPRTFLNADPVTDPVSRTPGAVPGPRGAGDPDDDDSGAPLPLPRRHTPKLVSSHGRPVTDQRGRRPSIQEGTAPTAARPGPDDSAAPLPARRRDTGPVRRTTPGPTPATGPKGAPGPTGATGPGSGPERPEAITLDPPAGPSSLPRRARGTTDPGEATTGPSGPAPDGPGTHRPPGELRGMHRARDTGDPNGTGPENPRNTGTPIFDGRTPRADAPLRAPGEGLRTDGLRGIGTGHPTDQPRTHAAGHHPAALRGPGQPRPIDAPGVSGASGDGTAETAAPDAGALPRRIRQANLAPQLRSTTERRTETTAAPDERDADEVRSRMASLQRGWQRGREENAAGDDTQSGTAPQGTTKGDGR